MLLKPTQKDRKGIRLFGPLLTDFRHFGGLVKLHTTAGKRLAILAIAALLLIAGTANAQNPIVTENALPGTAKSIWDISGAGDLSIQGFATDMSVNKGTTVRFKIDVDGAVNYTIRIYRLGYYGGSGARLISDLGSFNGINQPTPLSNATTGLVDCGNWTESATWAVPATAVSGLYIAKLTRSDNNGASHIVFVVRDDTRNAPVLFKTSDATWQAYNVYGGNSLYTGSTGYPGGHAVKVSYNRPFITRNGGGGGGAMEDWLFNAEYPMIRWMERNGYDVSYTTDVDMSRDATPITPAKHKVMLSVGHDEYWSAAARSKFENARNQGVNLGFFSGNEVYWKVRWENSIDGTGTPFRTLVCYKEGSLGENVCGGKCDPLADTWTGLWRDGCNFPNADGCNPENALTGQISWVDATGAISVSAAYRSLPIWRNTSVASLANGQSVTFTNGTLGYEWDGKSSTYASSYPANRQVLSSTSLAGETHELSLYTHSSGAQVFGAGTVQWSWGLDGIHDRGSAAPSRDMQQATFNIFSDMGVQAGSPQSDLVTDLIPPTITANTPANNATGVNTGAVVTATFDEDILSATITTATFELRNAGNTVIAANVSYDPTTRRATLTPSSGLANSTVYTATLKGGTTDPRVKDLAGNALAADYAWSFTTEAATPLTVTANTPANGANSVLTTTTLTATFNQTIDAGTLTSSTFELRNSAGTIIPGTVSYNATTRIATLTPSAALANFTAYTATIKGGSTDPVVKTAAGTAMANNHEWSFTTEAATPLTVTANTPTNGATSVLTTTTVTATFNQAIDAATLNSSTFELRNAAGTVIPGIVSYNATTRIATLTPSGALANSTVYTATLKGGSTDPRIKDLAGTALAADYVWSFTTASSNPQPTTYTIWSPTTVPGTITDNDNRSVELGVKFRAAVNGYITGMRFYKGPSNTGVHVGTLWSRTGTNLARATFINESASGWQQVLFSSPVAITAGTTYVASYHANVGKYSINENYFTANVGLSPNLQALANGLDGPNGVYRYSASSLFPSSSNKSSNYWVDVIFATSLTPDTTPPTVTANAPANGATGVSITSVITATFSEAIVAPNNTTFELRNASNTVIPGAISYNATTGVATFTPSSALANSTLYTATLKGGTTDPRIKDAAGNALSADHVWTFTTADPTPLAVSSTSPANSATGVSTNSVITAIFNQALDPGTVNTGTLELRNSSDVLIPASVVYNSSSLSATLTPSTELATSTVYTLTLKGGETGIKGLAGNALAANVAIQFTTSSQSALSGPFSIWSPTTVPGTIAANDSRAVELGVKFRATVDGLITGIRFYKSSTNTGVHVATLWSRTGTNLARATFSNETSSGWQQVNFTNPVAITAGTTYVASYHTNTGRYSVNLNYFKTTVTTPYLQALAQGVDGPNGIYRYSAGSIFPTSQNKSSNFWVDVVFTDNNPPRVNAVSPLSGATDVSLSPTITATFNEGIDPGSLTAASFELRNASNTIIPGTVSYNPTTRTATLLPSALAYSTVYTVTLKGGTTDPRIKDPAGNALAANYVWSFTTLAPTPLTVTANTPANAATGVLTTAAVTATFSQAIAPATLSSSTFELRNAANTLIPGNIGYDTTTRIATFTPSAPLANSTVYTATLKGGTNDPRITDLAGTALTADYVWNFTTVAPTPLTITASTPASGATGILTATTITATFSQEISQTSLNSSTFEMRNAANTVIPGTITYDPITRRATLTPSSALANSTAYTVTLKGGAADPRIVDLAGTAMSADYVWTFTTVSANPLTITSNSPANLATGVAVTAPVSATFDQAIVEASLNSSTFELKSAGNNIIAATISYNSTTRTATLTPSAALANSTVYTATLKGGASDPRITDLAGNALESDYIWSFTTVAASTQSGPFSIWPANTIPGTVSAADQQAVELGVKFRTFNDGFITGIRFFKSLGNTGTHTGNLWSLNGTNLGRATFSGESSTGWQEVLFDTPVAVNSGTTYVASYHTPTGNYSFDGGYFTNGVTTDYLEALANGVDGSNGVYSYSSASTYPTSSFNSGNYWVDVVFETSIGPDVKPPLVTSTSPFNTATDIAVSSSVLATFNEPIDASSVSGATFALKLSTGEAIPANISYASGNRTASLIPSSPLEYVTDYVATLKGIRDQAGNVMPDYQWAFRTIQAPAVPPADGPGGPILVISAASNPFSRYTTEILTAEGLNAFKAMDISTVSAAVLAEYDIVILGEIPLTSSQVTMLTDWTNAGGTFVAFRPDVKLASLLGITRTTGTRANEYIRVNASGAGLGIVNETIQYHGISDLYILNGATTLATLYSTENTATSNPAVTSRNVGVNGGQAIAFTYDLPRSIVYTRQGNPTWEGQDRDGLAPVRSNDLYYGNASFDRQPDWIDFKKVSIPQADEQQRLLANIIIQGNLDRKPLPRFWYLPKGLKAAVVMTGDDHGNGGTVARFNHYKDLSSSNTPEAVADWLAIRGSSYIYPNTPISNTELNAFQADGFEIGLHLNTNCAGYTENSWTNAWNSQWIDIRAEFPGINLATTNRTHCIPWSDWATQPTAEAAQGVRLDANYYYWPGSWVQSRAGMFTGSGIPMRFADLNGNIIDCYQVTTQVTDESDINNYSVFISSLLDKAIGAEGYYGTFCANMHTDDGTSSGSEAIITSAVNRGIPVISAKQLLTWLDGRNNSAFKSLAWNNNELSFELVAATGSRNLKGMLPTRTATQELSMIRMGAVTIPFTRQTIKGIEYAFFDATNGNYIAIYGNTTQPLASISDISEMNLLSSTQKTVDQNARLFVYPNPFSEYATAEFSTPANEKKVYLDVYNVNGVKVKNLYEGPTMANEVNRFEINRLNLSPGIYFIRFITPQKTLTTKIITN